MIPAPHTYSEWVNILDIFKAKSNDSEVLTAMKNGTVEWQSGVAERFSKRLIDSVNYRMNAASDKFQKEMSRAYGSEGAIVQALLALRKELSFLVQAINLPALPEKNRQGQHHPEQGAQVEGQGGFWMDLAKLSHFPHPVHRVKQQRKYRAHLQPTLYSFSPSPAGCQDQTPDQHASCKQYQKMRQAKHSHPSFPFFSILSSLFGPKKGASASISPMV